MPLKIINGIDHIEPYVAIHKFGSAFNSPSKSVADKKYFRIQMQEKYDIINNS